MSRRYRRRYGRRLSTRCQAAVAVVVGVVLARAVHGSAAVTHARAAPPAPARDGTAASKAVPYATAQLGRPYQWGGTGPDSFDCSAAGPLLRAEVDSDRVLRLLLQGRSLEVVSRRTRARTPEIIRIGRDAGMTLDYRANAMVPGPGTPVLPGPAAMAPPARALPASPPPAVHGRWQDRARCKQSDPEIFYSEHPDSVAAAKAACAA